jgi:hypothetical protein
MRGIEIAKELDRYPVVDFAHKFVWARRSIVQEPTIAARLACLAIPTVQLLQWSGREF